MNINERDYEETVRVQLTDLKVSIFDEWFEENNVEVFFTYGRYYFKRKEDAAAFVLRFGNMLMNNGYGN